MGERYTIAYLTILDYTHVAHDAGLSTSAFPSFEARRARVAGAPRYVNGLEPYPAIARRSAGRSISD